MFSSEAWLANPSSGFYNGVITSSLRLNGSNARLASPSFGSDLGDTWTWSAWVKFNNQKTDKRGTLFGIAGNNASLYFDSSGQSFLSVNEDGSAVRSTSRLLRDSSSWYHIVLNGNDTLNKLWINGELATFGTNANLGSINTAVVHYIGYSINSSYYWEGQIADINFVSETALDYTAFAETKNGVLIPKEPSVTYGANGFRLQFLKTGSGADANGIGADTSGNNKHFTATGLDAYDVLPDSPENNFCTMNPLINGYSNNITMSEGSLAGLGTSGEYNNTLGTFLMTSGKWYWEISSSDFNNYIMLGIAIETAIQTSDSTPYGQTGVVAYATHGAVYNETASGSGSYTDFLDSEIIGIAVDLDSGTKTFKFYNNNTLQGTINLSSAFDDIGILPFFCIGTNDTIKVNFGADSSFAGLKTAQGNTDANGIGDFYYAPPSGYLALCTANLPEPTISPNSLTQATDHFNTALWGGNSGTQDVVVGFQPDWVWLKVRNHTYFHELYDSSRGATKKLRSNNDSAEATQADGVTDFTASGGGFSLGAGAGGNESGKTYVAWNWKAGGTTPSKTYKVVVVSDSGNKYRFRNSADDATFAQSAVTLDLQEGGTYTFDYSDSTATSHPFRFSTTSDGTHGSGSEYTTGVVKDDTAKTITITVASSAPTLYYYCSAHSGMGGQVNTNTTSGQTNFDGSVLSVSNANTDAGFSIVTYTSNNSNSTTIGHGLGIKPDIMIQKNRSVTSNWLVLHQLADGTLDYQLLDSTSLGGAGSQPVATTSTVATWKSSSSDTTGNLMVAYCFSSIEGYSKFGSFTGNTSADGTFVALNFSPAMVIVKRVTGGSTYDWFIHDNERGAFNVNDERLAPNAVDIESTSITSMDFLSNGFKLRTANTSYNEGTVIYMAFAKNPFKYSTAQ